MTDEHFLVSVLIAHQTLLWHFSLQELNILTFYSPFDIICMTQVMSLTMLLHVVQNNDCRDEVYDLASRQQVQITTAIAAAVTVNPVELQFALWRRANFVKVVGFHHRRRDVKNDWAAAQVHADGAFFLVVLHVSSTTKRSLDYMLVRSYH